MYISSYIDNYEGKLYNISWLASFFFYFYPESTHRYMLASSPCRCLNCFVFSSAEILEPEVLVRTLTFRKLMSQYEA